MSDNILSKGTTSQITTYKPKSEVGELVFNITESTIVAFGETTNNNVTTKTINEMARADLSNVNFATRNVSMSISEITEGTGNGQFEWNNQGDPKFGLGLDLTGTSILLDQSPASNDPKPGEIIIRVPGIWIEFSVPYAELLGKMLIADASTNITENHYIRLVNFNDREVILGRVAGNKLGIRGTDTSSLDLADNSRDITRSIKFYRRAITVT